MAKYTELFSEYLEEAGGIDNWQPPAEFTLIDGFKDLFIAEYCDREIGFETPVLFEIKLKARSATTIPDYAEKLNLIKAAYAELENPVKKHIRTGGITRAYGATRGTATDQPFDIPAAQAAPSQINQTDEHTDNETYDQITDSEEGRTTAETLSYIQELNRKETDLMQKLLSEFNSLFMVIY